MGNKTGHERTLAEQRRELVKLREKLTKAEKEVAKLRKELEAAKETMAGMSWSYLPGRPGATHDG